MLIQHLKKHFGLYSLTFIIFIIAVINYKPGTYLTGWDTLHPEFDFGLNFKRLIFGVWRQEQGLGAVTGHSHMADLPRVVILWLFHFVFPLSTIRYLYVFLCLFFGPLGIYFLIHHLFRDKLHRSTELIAFLTGLFYLFNLGTVQQFFVPFEMFTTQYAVLPWIVLASLKYLQKPSRNNLLFFTLITLFSTPQAYAAHLWYAFFIIYLSFISLYILLHKRLETIKRGVTLIAFTILLNSFWLLPNLYFIKTSGYIPTQAKQTRLFSQEYGLRNREHGYLKDVALAKGFYFNWSIFNFEKERFDYLMDDWRSHLNNPVINFIGYGFFVSAVAGLFFCLKKRYKNYLIFLPFFLIPAVFLLNHTFPFDRFFDFLVQFSLFDQALRFVYTKFSIPLIFSYAIYFSYILRLVFRRLENKKWLYNIVGIGIVLSLSVYSLPIIQGRLISSKVKISIPQEYFQFWDFMKEQDDGTVLSLPLHTFSGWQYYDWGYQGSGFIWFGLKQPILDRDFDRWSIQNEQAYREFRYALYARNPNYFIKNLEKFNINYIFWDRTNITPSLKNRPQIIYDRESDLILSQLVSSGNIYPLVAFGNLNVYKVILANNISTKARNLPLINPKYRWSFFDQAFDKFGSYFTSLNRQGSDSQGYYFPYRDIFSYDDKLKKEYVNQFRFSQENKEILSFSSEDIFEQNSNSPGVNITQTPTGKALHFISRNTTNGIGMNFYSLSHDRGYILGIMSKNIKGLPLRFCLRNLYSTLCDIYDEVSKNKDFNYDYYFIPPTEGAIGYDLSIDGISYGDYDSVNELKEFFLIPISTEFMTTSQSSNTITNDQIYVDFKAYNSGWLAYRIKADPSKLKLWIRSLLPFLYGERLKEHVLVNNWANGWRISNQNSNRYSVVSGQSKTEKPNTDNQQLITIIFWPQYLEFIGFALFLGSFVWIITRKSNSF